MRNRHKYIVLHIQLRATFIGAAVFSLLRPLFLELDEHNFKKATKLHDTVIDWFLKTATSLEHRIVEHRWLNANL